MKLIEGAAITFAMLGAGTTITEPATGETAYNPSTSYAKGAEVVSTTTHRTYVSLQGQSATVLISNASPGVVTWAAHGLPAATGVSFTTTGALPTGLTTGQVYYVVNPTLNTFQLAATPTGTPINTSSAGSGVHTAVISTNLGNTPETSPLYWREKGATKKFAPFDTSPTTKASGTSPMTFSIKPGQIVDSFGLIAMTGVKSVGVKMTVGATTLYDRAFDLDNTIIDDWYDWLYAVDSTKAKLTAFDLPPHSGATITFTFTGDGVLEVGVIQLGLQYDVGALQAGARKPFRDFSKKDFDEFGQEIIVQRPFSRQLTGSLRIHNGVFEDVDRVMTRLRSKRCIWVGVQDHDDLTEPLTIYGFLRAFEPEFTYPTETVASFSVEGLSEQ